MHVRLVPLAGVIDHLATEADRRHVYGGHCKRIQADFRGGRGGYYWDNLDSGFFFREGSLGHGDELQQMSTDS